MSTFTPARVAAAVANLLAQVASQPTVEVGVPDSKGRVTVPRDLVVAVLAARAAEAEVAAAKKDAEDRLKMFLGEGTEAVVDGLVVASFKPGFRETFDSVAFRLDEPEVAQGYMRSTPTRSLLFKTKVVSALFPE